MSRESLWAYYRDDDVPLYQHTADTELEVLMQEAPGVVTTARLVREDTALGDALFAVVEEILTERERYVLEAWVYERLGVRAIGQQLSLSKSQVHRILQGALKKLKAQLSGAPAVIERLSLSTSPSVLSEETPCFHEEHDEADHVSVGP